MLAWIGSRIPWPRTPTSLPGYSPEQRAEAERVTVDKDQTIDDLVARGRRLTRNLDATLAKMERTLWPGQEGK